MLGVCSAQQKGAGAIALLQQAVDLSASCGASCFGFAQVEPHRIVFIGHGKYVIPASHFIDVRKKVLVEFLLDDQDDIARAEALAACLHSSVLPKAWFKQELKHRKQSWGTRWTTLEAAFNREKDSGVKFAYLIVRAEKDADAVVEFRSSAAAAARVTQEALCACAEHIALRPRTVACTRPAAPVQAHGQRNSARSSCF